LHPHFEAAQDQSPYTVDAGHFQFEMELAAWSKDGRERELSLGELNAKIGLDDLTDFTPFLGVSTKF
jgi:hypothetical protein